MAAWLAQRFAAALLLLFLVLSFVFFLIHLAPGDPTQIFEDSDMTADGRAAIRRAWGLDRPLPEQYLRWMGRALTGDWGDSFGQPQPVAAMIRTALGPTLVLAFAALTIRYGVGILLGVAAALYRDRWLDHLIRILSLALFSSPTFWLGLVAMFAFAVRYPIFPAGHASSIEAASLPAIPRLLDLLWHLALPALVLGLTAAGATARLVRNNLIEALGSDSVRMLRARGIPERRILWWHAGRNALAPVVQTLALAVPALLSGSLVTEVVFSWPGLGRLAYTAVQQRDFPVILASTALSGALVLASSVLADLLHGAVDPRVRRV